MTGCKSEKWVLLVGCEKRRFEAILQEHMDDVKYVHMVPDISEATRELTNIPILVLEEKYDGAEKIAIIKAGADEYLQLPETLWEVVASCQALIRRYTLFNQRDIRSRAIMLQEGVFINKELHRVFIHGKKLEFARREYDLFCLLASYPRRVFTHEQLFNQIWNVEQTPTENSLHSCIRRIRRKIESIPECSCRIKNIRGVGYYFLLNEKEKAALPLR